MFVEPSLKIVATILAKNEEDVIAENIEHHIKQGISQFIVTDNNSTDRTRSIVEKYPEVVEIIDEPGDDHHQSKWVTRMARTACKLNPDWIVHLDADELWGGFGHLRTMDHKVVGCEKMFLHPPTGTFFFGLFQMSHYLDFSPCGMPEECKVVHRPDPDVEITHGNHGVVGATVGFTDKIWRHHYPIRSSPQFIQKAEGHLALKRRGAICERWKKWHESLEDGWGCSAYDDIVKSWKDMIEQPNHSSLHTLLKHWSTPEVVEKFKEGSPLPTIGKWPKT